MSNVELHFGAATDVGLVRERNEDAYLAEPPVFVVADGMGGHQGGDVASGIAVEEFARLARTGYDDRHGPEEVVRTLRECQRRIEDYGESHKVPGEAWYAGTTVVAALLVTDHGTDKWLLANLGDSRAYRVVDGELDQVSVDHSLVQDLIDAGMLSEEDAGSHPDRHVITRALGGPRPPDPDFFLLPLASAERLLLCSDGVSGMLDRDELAAILTEVQDPRDAADQLVAAALAAGGEDNATAVVVDVVGLATNGDSYDATQQRLSMQQKLGALP